MFRGGMARGARAHQEEAEAGQHDHGDSEDQLALAGGEIHARYFFRRTGLSQNGVGASRGAAWSRPPPSEGGGPAAAFPVPAAPFPDLPFPVLPFPVPPPRRGPPELPRPGQNPPFRDRCGGPAWPPPPAGPAPAGPPPAGPDG